MRMEEGISWILDRPHTEILELKKKYPSRDEYLRHHGAYNENNYQKNIDFVHSLGLKCDCVGWCCLDFDRPDIGEILDRIEAFCQKDGWLARGGYGRRYVDFASDWYELQLPNIENVVRSEGITYAIHAYKNCSKPLLAGWCQRIPAVVSEKFREVCIKNNIQGIDFCWAKDIGRYESAQYAFMYPAGRIQTIACDNGVRYSDEYFPYSDGNGGTVYMHTHEYTDHSPGSPLYKRLQILGGYLPRLAEVFYKFQFNLQDYYRADELPENGFAFVQGKSGEVHRETLLIHKDTAEILMRENMLNATMLSPALTYHDRVPAGYEEVVLEDDTIFPSFNTGLALQMEEEYRIIKSIRRSQRKATDSMALKALREAKRERKEDFGKRIKKEIAESMSGTAYEALSPYYLAADGGHLSNEYQFLNYISAKEQTLAFERDMAKEELAAIPRGIVFCQCADGDRVLLTKNGVIRVSHEIPEILEEWQSAAQFFFDVLTAE